MTVRKTSRPADLPAVYFYRRDDCELCEELARELGEYRAAPGACEFRLIARDVDADARWAAQYGELLPVLEIGGIPVCEYFFDAARLEAGLRRAQSAGDLENFRE